MSSLDDLFSKLPIDSIASALGVDPSTAADAVAVVLPTLLGGMAANAEDPAGAASLEKALVRHEADDSDGYDVNAADIADGDKIVNHIFGSQTDNVVNQLAGATKSSALSSGLFLKLLPLLAPFVMKYIAGLFKRHSTAASAVSSSATSSGSSTFDVPTTDAPSPTGTTLPAPSGSASPDPDTSNTSETSDSADAGGGLGSILGGLLGGGSSGSTGGGLGSILGGLLGGGSSDSGSGGGLGSILGGLLGGGSSGSSGGGLGSILGGLLGQGSR